MNQWKSQNLVLIFALVNIHTRAFWLVHGEFDSSIQPGIQHHFGSILNLLASWQPRKHGKWKSWRNKEFQARDATVGDSCPFTKSSLFYRIKSSAFRVPFGGTIAAPFLYFSNKTKPNWTKFDRPLWCIRSWIASHRMVQPAHSGCCAK